ncbi:MAG: DUF433 domain-containing protein [Planctomycetota bacterium]
MSGRPCETKGGGRRSKPLIVIPEAGGLSFMSLMEGYAISIFRRVHGVPMQRVRRALEYLREKFLDMPYPFATQEIWTDGLDLFIQGLQQGGGLVSLSEKGQGAFRELVAAHARRIEWDREHMPMRYYPITRSSYQEDRPVWIDPEISFGQPVLAGTRVKTSIITDRFIAGDSVAEIANDFDVIVAQVEEAIRWEKPATAA